MVGFITEIQKLRTRVIFVLCRGIFVLFNAAENNHYLGIVQ